MKALVIPEDPTLDQYILKPIVERLFGDLERKVRVEVLSNPRLHSVEQALDQRILEDIVATYRMFDLFLVLVDRDGDAEARPSRARAREASFEGRLLVCLAIEEVEVWMLALHRERVPAPWRDVRAEPHPKERYAEPFLAAHAPRLSVGRGRKWAMRNVGREWKGLLEICPELAELKDRIATWLGGGRER